MPRRAGTGWQQDTLSRLNAIEDSARKWAQAYREAAEHPQDAAAQDALREASEDHARDVDRLAG